MRHSCEIASCDEGTHNVLCREHCTELLTKLCELAFTVNNRGERGPGLLEALDGTVARQRATGSKGTGGRSAAGPVVPYDPKASRVADEAGNTISTWARSIEDAFPSLRPTYSTLAGACAWMATLAKELTVYYEADRMHQEITRLVSTVENAVDHHDELRYAGICSSPLESGGQCEQDLFVRPGKAIVQCRYCQAQHDVEQRREALYRAAQDQLASAVDCSRIAPNLVGRQLSASTIRHWAREGKLSPRDPHPHDERNAPRYRIGDVVKLARESQTRRRKAVRDPPRKSG